MTTVIDYHEAIDKAGGNPELAKDLFGMLLQELPLLRQQLQDAIAQADLQAIWDHTHKLYGSTAYCSVPNLHRAAGDMETTVKSQELPAIRSQFTTLEAAIEELLAQGPGHLAAEW